MYRRYVDHPLEFCWSKSIPGFRNGAGKHSIRVLAEDSDKPQQMVRILKVRIKFSLIVSSSSK